MTPVLRGTVLARYGGALRELIDRVSARLGTGQLRGLDARIALGEAPRAIAAAWLASHGLT